MKYKKTIILSIIFIIIIFIMGIVIFANSMLNKVNITDWSDTTEISESELIKEDEPENLEELEKVDSDEVDFGNQKIIESIPNITNILLIGEENVYKSTRGRTDSMMILTINKINGSIKLTSLMRDSYVEIPNKKNNRLNAAYGMGGVPLLKETIELNYGITINNTVLVDFEAFEKIIDILGGVEIELTKQEANYLNKENYISDKNSRTVSEGWNTLNGTQALGYARIRYVKGITGELNDFGRTNRQRTILSAIFDKYKEKDLTSLIKLVEEVLPFVQTDMKKEDIINYLIVFMTMDVETLETYRIPIDKGYNSVNIDGMAVLQLDWDKNRECLKNFIYEESKTDTKLEVN